jgi:hypothetical protein
MDFETYLKSKKIDPLTFQKAEPVLWQEFRLIFDQVHPDSFTAQKLFLINGIRRKYPLHEEPEARESMIGESETDKKTVQPKPKFTSPSAEAGKAKPKVRMVPKIKKKEE